MQDTIDTISENISKDGYQHPKKTPARHVVVTAWLIFMLLTNSFSAIIYLQRALLSKQKFLVSTDMLIFLAITCLINTASIVMLLFWKKIGFYILMATAVIAFIINIELGISVPKTLLGLSGFVILYYILQLKKEGSSAWYNLK